MYIIYSFNHLIITIHLSYIITAYLYSFLLLQSILSLSLFLSLSLSLTLSHSFSLSLYLSFFQSTIISLIIFFNSPTAFISKPSYSPIFKLILSLLLTIQNLLNHDLVCLYSHFGLFELLFSV